MCRPSPLPRLYLTLTNPERRRWGVATGRIKPRQHHVRRGSMCR
ncbi:hypothetical protein [Ornithinimicrobium kibberense]